MLSKLRSKVSAKLKGSAALMFALAATGFPAFAGQFHVIKEMGANGIPFLASEVTPGEFVGVSFLNGPPVFPITAFSVNGYNGALKTLYSFSNPATGSDEPEGIGVVGPNGLFYGSMNTSPENAPRFFTLSLDGTLTFVPVSNPAPLLTITSLNGIYAYLPSYSGLTYGYFAKVDWQDNMTIVHNFTSAEGYLQYLTLGHDGFLYGILGVPGSTTGAAQIFRMSPSGQFVVLATYQHGIFGGAPATLVQSANGNLYGTTWSGGAKQAGSIFELSSLGFKTIYSFANNQTGLPTSILEASDGNLYGLTQLAGNGSVWSITPGGTFTSVFQFSLPSVEGSCQCTMMQGSDGKLYGAATGSGKYGYGTVWVLDLALPIPKPIAKQFGPTAGPVGTKVTIWGDNMLKSQAVSFNGTLVSTFQSQGANFITAVVPVGATSGPITVTTAGGVSTTKSSFQVQ